MDLVVIIVMIILHLDLYNLTLDEAQRTLDKLNLDIRVNIEDEYSNEVEKGKIISQQPISGT